MSFIDVLLTLILLIIGWFIFTFAIIIHLRVEAKKKWNKNKENYPYFQKNMFYKLWLFGLKGVINPLLPLFTFIYNISTLTLCFTGIWYMISPNEIIFCIFRVAVVAYGVSLLLKLIFYAWDPPSFK